MHIRIEGAKALQVTALYSFVHKTELKTRNLKWGMLGLDLWN